MGLAASQARLLSITSRLSDNELRAQLINNQKIRLATESSGVSDDYVKALNNSKMMFTNYDADNNKSYDNLTFNSLTAYNPYNNQYGLSNQNGSILVSEDDAVNFQKANGNLNAFLASYNLEETTSYFGDAMLAKYTVDGTPNGEVYLYKIPLFNNSYNYGSTGYSPNDLKTIYEGGITSDGVSHIGYEACITSQDFISYDNYRSSDLVSPDMILKRATLPAINSYIQTLSSNGISISSENSNDILKKMEELAQLDASESNFNQAYSYLDGMYNIMDILRGRLGGATDSESYQYFTSILSSIESFDDRFTAESIDTTTTPGITYLSMPAADGTGSDSEVPFFIGVDINGVADFYKFDATGLPMLAPEATTGSTITEGDDSYQLINSISYETDADGHHIIWTKQLTDSDGAITTKSQDYFMDTISNNNKVKTRVTSSEDDYDLTSISNFVNTLLTDFYNTYDSNVCSELLLSEAQIEELRLTGNTDFTNTIFEGLGQDVTTKENLKNAAVTYVSALDDYFKLTAVLLTQNVKDFNTMEAVFNTYGEPNYCWVDTTDPNADGNSKMNWYLNLFNRMSTGYQVLQDGLASSKDWIQFALESGLVSMEQVDDGSTWNSFTYSCCSDITEQTDSAVVTKAEAEYNQKMNMIEAKDQRFDMELKNIDTEHNSLQTEYESIKSVIDKNIGRTFKIYS